MVVLVVILATAVASFCYDTAGDLQGNGIVGAKAVRADDGAILVSYLGSESAAAVDHLNWTIDGTEQADRLDAVVGSSAFNTTVSVNLVEHHRVIVTATYGDGSSQVVLDTVI